MDIFKKHNGRYCVMIKKIGRTVSIVFLKLITVFLIINTCFAASENIATSSTKTNSEESLTMSIEQRLVAFVHKTVDTLRYSAYKLGGTRFDTKRGVYVLDCSDYVDHILHAIYPKAYSSLVASSGSDKPTSEHYFDFFTGLEDEPSHYWNKVDNAVKLQPGDILVFRNKDDDDAGGHVMVVMGKPKRTANSVALRVADSAPVGHSHDTRSRHVSGIGIGTMLLKVNPRTGQPYAYAWKIGSSWNQDVNFAMARPTDKKRLDKLIG